MTCFKIKNKKVVFILFLISIFIILSFYLIFQRLNNDLSIEKNINSEKINKNSLLEKNINQKENLEFNKKIKINSKIIKVEIADTLASQYQGLSDREKICSDCGMLFVFKTEGNRSFVMRNMKFPLDIIFIRNNIITKIYSDLPPAGANPRIIYRSPGPVNQVLELNAFSAKNWGIKLGDRVNLIQ